MYDGGFTIAHITDLHVAREEDYAGAEADHWVPRVRKHSTQILRGLLHDLRGHRPDHVVLTGDLTQTSKRWEFEEAARILREALGDVGITALPGNHDRWSREAVEGRRFERAFAPWIRSDLQGEGYPTCRLLDDVAVIALDSSPYVEGEDPALVCGHVPSEQLERLIAWAELPEVRKRFLVVALHHHLRLSEEDANQVDPKDPTPLTNAREVEEALARTHVGLVLHGHRHRQMRLDLDLGGRSVPVLCPGSSSRADARVERTAKYGLYRIDRGALVEARFRMWDPFGERMEWMERAPSH